MIEEWLPGGTLCELRDVLNDKDRWEADLNVCNNCIEDEAAWILESTPLARR